ncbi:MAG: hypothetical protein IPH44_23830 [Myxococcales bacterium]|nr:hypothetical protein [Myxococcales bacterium]MBK7196022.1 hypothetical protein [Myxococcales bacterium]MBP6843958.1 hypothetical protein [Kofleriaceae bacterium]
MRLRRLKADYEALRRLARLHPRIDIEGVVGNPPERYRIRLTVKSLREKGDAIETATDHWLEVSMPRGYPRDAPLFRMLTPVFHPNIAPHAVCIGDDWTAGEPIEHLIQRVGEILAFQSYNTKSPLNGRAAQWVDEHRDQLPIDREEFFLDLSAEPAAPPAVAAAQACSNCGSQAQPMVTCGKQHRMCPDCTIPCKTCGALICLSCGMRACAACAAAPSPPAAAPVAVAPSPFAPPVAAPSPFAAPMAAPAPFAPPVAAPAPFAGPRAPAAAPSPFAPPAASPEAVVTRCQNCHILLGARTATCPAGHRLCGDCSVVCRGCSQVLCLVCNTYPCKTCAPT